MRLVQCPGSLSSGRRLGSLCASFAVGLMALSSSGWAQRAHLPSDDHPAPLPYHDVRLLEDGLVTAPVRSAMLSSRTAEQRAARDAEVLQLRSTIAELRLDDDEFFGTPHFLRSTKQLLTSAPSSAWTPLGVVADFVSAWPALMEVTPADLAAARVARHFVTQHNGATHMTLQQQIGGIDLWGTKLKASVTGAGELINVSSTLLPRPSGGFSVAAPMISDADAIFLAAADVGIELNPRTLAPAGTATGVELHQLWQTPFELRADTPLTSELIYFPVSRSEVHPAWTVVIAELGIGNTYEITVDALDGTILRRWNRLHFAGGNESLSVNVFPWDSPAPGSPGTSTPTGFQFPIVPRQLVTVPGATSGSPEGWIPDGSNETLGNNVDAHTDLDANNIPDLPRPQGSPYRVFDFPLDLNQPPSAYRDAAVTQLFYYCNLIHDKLYGFGFDEAASNFQNDNFGLGGFGGDRLSADAQDGSSTNNANWNGNGIDGQGAFIQMYVFDGPNPDRDGDFDGDVVYHEYVHGLSIRLSGGDVFGNQSGGMGEGWGDYFGLSMNTEPGDDPDAVYAAGGYITKDFFGEQDNYYFGIRRYPYSTDLNKSPLTYADADPAQLVVPGGIPANGTFIGNPANEVHNVGELWCQALLECRSALWNGGMGFAANDLLMQLVVDGMKLMPGNPNFLEARDSILAADIVAFGGAHLGELWEGFAKRGMGASASSPSGSTTSGIVEAFDTPVLIFFDYPAGQPSQLMPGMTTSLDVDVSGLAGDMPVNGTGMLHYQVNGGSTVSTAMASTGVNQYEATLPALNCFDSVVYWVSSDSTSGVVSDPPNAPTGAATAEVFTSIDFLLNHDFEASNGWQGGVAGDTATTGVWERGDPLGTTAQPEEDLSPLGTACFFTGQGTDPNSVGENDVDGGFTTLLSPSFDLSGGTARVSYWRWYNNTAGSAPNADIFEVDISNNGGGSWVNAETVGPAGPDTSGGWVFHQFEVSDFVTPTSDMQLRFVAADEGSGSIVEAAVDDVQVSRLVCSTSCQTNLGFGGPGDMTLNICGPALSTGATNDLTVSNATPGATVFVLLGLSSNPTPFKGGLLVPVPLSLILSFAADGSGDVSVVVPGGNGPASIIVQAAAVDAGQPLGYELSNAVDVSFLP
ncbi:MAG: hypothetical protein ACI9EF_000745 [Pseudohongiellaceae bacterium]|jgi:hypothetical protein